jgi:YbbR domain-containing protein
MATPGISGAMRPRGGEQFVSAREAGRRRSRVSNLAQALKSNLGLRLISVGLAIGLWIFVNAGQHGSLESIQVPVSYRDLPPGYVIVNPHPDFVRIQVSGPRTLLSLIDPARLTLRLDLTGVGIGQASFKIGPEAFPVPRQTNVTGVLPSQIVLEIDKNVTRDMPVHLVTIGIPGDGYKVASTDVSPAAVGVRGPSREIARIDRVDTEPLSIAGITSDLSTAVSLMAPSNSVRLAGDEVSAKVTLGPIIGQRQFRDLTVAVRDTDFKFRVDPRHVTLELRGPTLTLDKLNLNNAVYVEAGGLEPGSYSLPVQVNLPDDVGLMHQTPAKVRVRVYHERQAQSG